MTKDIPTREQLKEEAHAMWKTGKKLTHCYEALARSYGFKTYASFIAYHKERDSGTKGNGI